MMPETRKIENRKVYIIKLKNTKIIKILKLWIHCRALIVNLTVSITVVEHSTASVYCNSSPQNGLLAIIQGASTNWLMTAEL